MGAAVADAAELLASGRRRQRMKALQSTTLVMLLAASCVLLGSKQPQKVPMPLTGLQEASLPSASSSSSSGNEGGGSSSGDSSDSSSSSSSSSLSIAMGAKDQDEDNPPPLQLQAQLLPGFRFNRVVAIVAYDRFKYFRRVRTPLWLNCGPTAAAALGVHVSAASRTCLWPAMAPASMMPEVFHCMPSLARASQHPPRCRFAGG